LTKLFKKDDHILRKEYAMSRVMTILFIFTLMAFIVMSCGMQGSKSPMTSVKQKTEEVTIPEQISEETSKPEQKTGEVSEPDFKPEEAAKSEQKAGDVTKPDQKSIEASKPEEKYMVEIVNFRFSPATLRIPSDTKVTWINRDRTFHTVTSDNGIFSSGNLAKGWTFSHTFESEGTYEYHCETHSYMKGKVVVE
jgi:plastocyanin